MSILTETVNEYYGRVNRRFDSRCRCLHKMGYVRRCDSRNRIHYVRIDPNCIFPRWQIIPARLLQSADSRLWIDTLRSPDTIGRNVAKDIDNLPKHNDTMLVMAPSA